MRQRGEQRRDRAVAIGALHHVAAIGIREVHARVGGAGVVGQAHAGDPPAGADMLAFDQPLQVAVGDHVLGVGQRLRLGDHLVQLRVFQHVAQRAQAIGDRGAATVAAQHQLRILPADVLRPHDFVGAAVLQHAVLVDAGFMRECVETDDRLVALDLDAGDPRQQPRRGQQLRRVQPGVRAVVAGAHLQRHRQLLHRRVAGTFADAVDGAFDLARTALDRGQRVRDGQAQVVVAVRAEDHAVGAAHVGAQVFEQRADFAWRGVTDGVRHVERARAGFDGGLEDADQEFGFGAQRVLGGELHVLDVAARAGDAHHRVFDDLVFAHA